MFDPGGVMLPDFLENFSLVRDPVNSPFPWKKIIKKCQNFFPVKIQKHNGRLKTDRDRRSLPPVYSRFQMFYSIWEIWLYRYSYSDSQIFLSICRNLFYFLYIVPKSPSTQCWALCVMFFYIEVILSFFCRKIHIFLESKGAPWTYCSSGVALTWTVTGLV